MASFTELDQKCVNTIRLLAADTVQKANSGHPGAPMGMAPMAHALFSRVLNIDPKDAQWINRDRFVLSNGHASSLLYSMLHLCNCGVSLEEMQTFRQIGSRLAGHPESHDLPGVEVTTGPLGNGISSAVGLAIAEKHMAATFNKADAEIFNHNVYVFCGDGCLQEGVASEACSLAGTLGLDNLIVLYDDNKITIDGPTSLSFQEDVAKRFEAYGWEVHTVPNGDSDLAGILKAIEAAKARKNNKPQMLKVATTIGFGAKLQGTAKVHGSPLGDEDIERLKAAWGFGKEKFFVPAEVSTFYKDEVNKRQEAARQAWNAKFEAYKTKYPSEFATLDKYFIKGEIPSDLIAQLPQYKPTDKPEATRKSSEIVMAKIGELLPTVIGGSADLVGSTLAQIKNSSYMKSGDFTGRNIPFGIREHAMCAIGNGIAAFCKGMVPYVSTFFVFGPYALGAIRLAALSHLRVIHIFTHDSIGVGEDGPTHQPIETLTQFRALPNMYVFRPCDGRETVGAYAAALNATGTPSVLALSRQNLPQLENSSAEKVAQGAYTVYEAGTIAAGKAVILIATGSEVSLAIDAAKKLQDKVGVRVVSAPCLELFRAQPVPYKASLLPAGIPVVSVEAGATFAWNEFSHAQIGIDSFGVSAPASAVYAHFKLTPEHVADRVSQITTFYSGKVPHDLINKP
ncbi:putative Transketolase [Blattamonas nauphoetae]|uniref:Transketolase n=1 Tax=Blattamonas nauphoetae TaxID=2049346 RepID=A0ABQ9YHP7_9EUKA|nr:putative Transketolase [Blattamonas nauphoetae]